MQMGLVDRIREKIRTGASAALAPAPDPRITQLTSHQKQRALRNQVGQAIENVIAAKQRLRAAADAIRERLPALEEQARTELKAGREAMARLALQRARGFVRRTALAGRHSSRLVERPRSPARGHLRQIPCSGPETNPSAEWGLSHKDIGGFPEAAPSAQRGHVVLNNRIRGAVHSLEPVVVDMVVGDSNQLHAKGCKVL